MGNIMITSYGNGQLMLKILNAIAGMMSDSNYVVLVMLILGLATTLGIVGYHRDMASVGISAHSTWIVKGFTTLAIFWMITGAHVNVFVYDPLNAFSGVADNVPISIALPLNFENQISSEMATLAGNYFAPNGYASEFLYDNPNAGAGFYNPGMASPLLAIETAMRANSTDMYFSESMKDYGANCLVPAMSIGVVNPNDLQTSSDIEDLLTADMANMPSGWTGTFYTSSNPGGTTYTCAVDWDNYIVPEINNMVNPSSNGRYTNQFQNTFNSNTGSTQNELADTELLGNAASYMFNFSITGQQALAQAALMNSVGGGISQAAAQTGTSGTAQSYAVTQAFSEIMNAWTTSAITGPRILPIMHMVLLCLVIAVLPFIFALAVIPTMTGKYMKMVFELLLWFALWAPIASVINFLVNSYMASKVFINVNNPNSYTAGFNLANYDFITNHLHEYIAITGGLMWTVPLFSFMLVSGSAFAMTSVAGAIGGTAHGLSSNAGTHVGSQNGLGAIQGAAAKQEGWQQEQEQGINPISADEKIAGMGGLDNLSNASAFGNNLQANGFRKIIDAKSNNMASNIGGGLGYGNMGTAKQTGMIGTEQTVGSRQGVATAAGLKGMSVESMSGQSAETNALQTQDSINNYAEHGINVPGMAQNIANTQGLNLAGSKGMSIKAQGNSALGSIRSETPLGQVMGNNFNGKYSEGGGNWEINGVLNRTQAERLYNSGLITGKAKTELGNALKSGEQAFNINAGGAGNSITGLALSNKQGTVVAADGTYSNLMNKSIGSKTWTGDTYVHDTSSKDISGSSSITDNSHITKSGTSSVTDDSNSYKVGNYFQSPEYGSNQAFLNDGSYINNYAQYTPGGSGLISKMKAKDTGAFATFNQQTQNMIGKYAGNKNVLTFSAKVTDEIEASGGLKLLGTGVQDKFKASISADGSSMMETNALNTETGNQLTKYANEYKTGEISWSQYQNKTNGLISTYKTLVNMGSTPSAAEAVKLGRNVINANEIKNYNNTNDIKSGQEGIVKGDVYYRNSRTGELINETAIKKENEGN
ncbi:MAG: conjugal transfer protein TraG N-terminal domain-containing protein [bacterium]